MNTDDIKQLKECLALVRRGLQNLEANAPEQARIDIRRAMASLPLSLRDDYVEAVSRDIVAEAQRLIEVRPNFDDVDGLTTWMSRCREVANRAGGVPVNMRNGDLRKTLGQLSGAFKEARVEVERRVHSDV